MTTTIKTLKVYNGQNVFSGYDDIKDEIENLEIRDDDVWLCCFPKTGSTWCHEMVWMILNDYDYEAAKEYTDKRIVFLERNAKTGKVIPEKYKKFFGNTLEIIKEMKSPRAIRTHLFAKSLPKQIREKQKNPKIIYLTRNPKDVALADHNQEKILSSEAKDLEGYCEDFIEGKVAMSPFWDHVLPYWEMRHKPNFFFLTYEEMKKDLRRVILRVVKFLGKTIDEEQMQKLLRHLDIETMRNNKYINMAGAQSVHKEETGNTYEGTFINKGEVGRWKNLFSPELVEKFDKWIEENTKGTGLSFE